MANYSLKTSICFDDASIRSMFRAEYYTYERMQLLSRTAIGLALIGLGIFTDIMSLFRVILLMAGCWLAVSQDFPSQMRAERVLQSRGGQKSTVNYHFMTEGIEIEGAGFLPYRKIDRLVADKNYFYLFENRQNAVMVDRTSLNIEEQMKLSEFLQKTTGKDWQQNKSLLSLNLKDIKQIIRDRMNKN